MCVIPDENIRRFATIWKEPTGENLTGIVKLTQSSTHTHTHSHTFSFMLPTRETLTEAALPVTVAAIILQALSTDHLLQAYTLLTTSLSTRIPSVHTVAQKSTPHILYIFTHTHVCVCAFHPQFTPHKRMTRMNRNDVLVQKSCSSHVKHTSLCGCECSGKNAHTHISPLFLTHYHRWDSWKTANTHTHTV